MAQAIMGHYDSDLFIDLNAITCNWLYIDSLSSGKTTTAAVVKANGYGLGANEVAGALAKSGCNEFFVANLGEAISLRQHFDSRGFTEPNIMTLHGCQHEQLVDHKAFRITPVLNDLDQISRWRAFSQQQIEPLPALLHFDTGMNRLGLDPEQTKWLLQNKSALDGLSCRFIMSHLACGEVINSPENADQLATFTELQVSFSGIPASLANSAGSILPSEYHFQMTRPGIALYGAHPAEHPTKILEPTVKWQARIIQVRQAKTGNRVGYGGTHQLCRDSVIATIGVGYADGYNRGLGGKARVLVGNETAPVIGRVSMDSITVDVTDIDPMHLRHGTVELLHQSYDLPQMAADAGTISYEILTKLGPRLTRHYQNG